MCFWGDGLKPPTRCVGVMVFGWENWWCCDSIPPFTGKVCDWKHLNLKKTCWTREGVTNRKLTWLDGTSTMNEDVFPNWKWGIFQCHLSFQGWIVTVRTSGHVSTRGAIDTEPAPGGSSGWWNHQPSTYRWFLHRHMRETPRDPVDTSELRPRSRWKVHPFQAVASQSVGPRSKDLEMLDVGPGSGSDPVGFIYLESPEEKGGRQGATSHSGKHADICRLTPSCRSVKPAKKEATEAPVERNSSTMRSLLRANPLPPAWVPQCSTWPKWAYVSYLMQKISRQWTWRSSCYQLWSRQFLR